MKSFYSILKTEHSVLVAVFLSVLVSFVVLVAMDRSTRMSVDELRDALGVVNRMVITVYLDEPSLGPDSVASLRESAARLQGLSAAETLDPATLEFLDAPVRTLRGDGPEAVRSKLQKVAAELSDAYFAGQRRLSRIVTAYVITLVALGLALVLVSVRTRRRYRGMVEHTLRLLDDVVAVIGYRRDDVDITAHWREEEVLADAASRLVQSIRADRDMAGDWMYGNLEAFMPRLKRTLETTMPCDRVAVAFTDADGGVVAESAATSLAEVHLEPGFHEPLQDTTLAHIADSGRARIINDLEAHYRDVHQSAGTEKILAEGIRSSITVPIVVRGQCKGFLFVSSTERFAYTAEHAASVTRIVNVLGPNIFFHYLTQQTVAATANAFVNLMEHKDNETSLHITRMSRYSHAIARALSQSDERVSATTVREILWFAPLHDIGKIGIPDAVLLKPGALTPGERRVIEQHVDIGVRVIEQMQKELTRILDLPLLPTALDIIRGHHEWFDGCGYPSGLAGEDIPVAGRITAIADVFDALTSRRPYKDPMPVAEALRIIEAGVGTQFDPAVYRAFLDAMDDISAIFDAYKET
ncbi:MAG: HD domain-containing phosphohydrolase [Spirochaetota bacterium]